MRSDALCLLDEALAGNESAIDEINGREAEFGLWIYRQPEAASRGVTRPGVSIKVPSAMKKLARALRNSISTQPDATRLLPR